MLDFCWIDRGVIASHGRTAALVLGCLEAHEAARKRPATALEIAEELNLSVPAVRRALKTLAGLVRVAWPGSGRMATKWETAGQAGSRKKALIDLLALRRAAGSFLERLAAGLLAAGRWTVRGLGAFLGVCRRSLARLRRLFSGPFVSPECTVCESRMHTPVRRKSAAKPAASSTCGESRQNPPLYPAMRATTEEATAGEPVALGEALPVVLSDLRRHTGVLPGRIRGTGEDEPEPPGEHNGNRRLETPKERPKSQRVSWLRSLVDRFRRPVPPPKKRLTYRQLQKRFRTESPVEILERLGVSEGRLRWLAEEAWALDRRDLPLQVACVLLAEIPRKDWDFKALVPRIAEETERAAMALWTVLQAPTSAAKRMLPLVLRYADQAVASQAAQCQGGRDDG